MNIKLIALVGGIGLTLVGLGDPAVKDGSWVGWRQLDNSANDKEDSSDYRILIADSSAATAAAVVEEITPKAFCRKIEKTVQIDGQDVDLNFAVCFDAWEGGEKPQYEDLAGYLVGKGDAARLSHLDWVADFVITFDRDVPEGGVDVFGQTDFFGGWQKFPLPSFEANVGRRLLNMDIISYGMLLDTVVNFNCGATGELSGVTMTIDLRLYDPNDEGHSVSLAVVRHCFLPDDAGNWFDANVANCGVWPQDMRMASGGSWASGTEHASMFTRGKLDFGELTKAELAFAVDEAKDLSAVQSVAVNAILAFDECEANELPVVDPVWKYGVLVVAEGPSSLAYYGLVRDGDTNVWGRLEGPMAVVGTDVQLTVVLKQVNGVSFVRYQIDGSDYAWQGETDIEIAMTGSAVSKVMFGGSGVLSDLYASVEGGSLVPVDPSCGVEVEAVSAEEALAKVEFVPATEVADAVGEEGLEDYKRMFAKVAVRGASAGVWIVTAVLNESGTNALQQVAEKIVEGIQGLSDESTTVTVVPTGVVPGFYYGLSASPDVGSAKMTKPDVWKLATQDGIPGGLSAEKPSAEKGFFAVHVDCATKGDAK